ncbi:MAG TPA: hypothetical protein VF794_02025 [Archangium sp.]|jgi:hypothetical protein|uniref:hypothetical protein n=1 Tax=Archangium sp. TaxID=1872627 RepID=UPI002ED961FD
MRGTGSKVALFTLVAMLGSVGCGGPLEEEGSFEEQEALTQEETWEEEVSALEQDHPSSCKTVKASPKLLWPPNHKFHLVKLSGAKSITITSVKQDEPVNDRGDGNTSPDAMWAQGKKDAVYLRAERSGRGDGRVYCISFTAKDSQGKTCKGMIQVGVPHDMGKGSYPVNSGCKYDSFGY